MVEQSNNHDGRVDYFNNSKISDGWTVEHLMVEQWNRNGGTAGGGKVELLMVEQETEMVEK